jgi:hypothetical protein
VASHGQRRGGSAVRDLGCTIVFFKLWIERHFLPGMTWANYGSLWQIDHKKALSFFDLSKRDQFLLACHYTNLQPMLAIDNQRKGGANRKRAIA